MVALASWKLFYVTTLKILVEQNLTLAFGEIEISGRTLLAIIASKVDFAIALRIQNFFYYVLLAIFKSHLSIGSLTNVVSGAIEVALARSAVGIAEISFRALVAVRSQEFGSALALSGLFGAVSGREEMFAVASYPR